MALLAVISATSARPMRAVCVLLKKDFFLTIFAAVFNAAAARNLLPTATRCRLLLLHKLQLTFAATLPLADDDDDEAQQQQLLTTRCWRASLNAKVTKISKQSVENYETSRDWAATQTGCHNPGITTSCKSTSTTCWIRLWFMSLWRRLRANCGELHLRLPHGRQLIVN